MLLIALFALILGILCLYFEMDMYNFEIDGGPSVSVDAPIQVAALPTCTQRLTDARIWTRVGST
jgi:hypothetical protein